MARPVISGGSRSKKPRGQYSKDKSKGAMVAQIRSDMKSGKMKMMKNEVPLGGIGKIAAKIVGGAVIEGIGGPKARGAKVAVKTSAKLARAIAREAAGDRAKGIVARKVPLYKLDKAKLTVKGGSSTTITKGTSAKQAPLTKAQREQRDAVTVRYESPKKLKAAAKARKDEPRLRRENVPAPSRNVAPRKSVSKPVRRARTVDQLGKSSSSRLEKKITAKQEAKLIARKNRANRPALAAKNRAAVKRAGEKIQTDKKRISEETKFFNDKTPVIQYDSAGRIIGKTTKGELRQLSVKTKRAAADPRNSTRGGKQETIDQRQPRPRNNMTDREVEIARIVGKRDYSRGEVSPLAQRILDAEADRRVGVFLKDPRVKAQDAARVKAAIEKANRDKELGKTLKSKRKNFRGKPMK